MKSRKIKNVIGKFVEVGIIIFSFYAIFYLLLAPDKTIKQIIFLCVYIGLFVWIIALQREKSILKVELLKRLKADLLLKSDFAKAGVASEYKEEKDILVYVLGLLGYEKESLDTVEDIDSLLK